MKITSLFLDAIMEDGTVGKKAALQKCVDIIDVIFDYEEEFKFNYPIRDIGVLGQNKLGWITQKAIEILNRNRYDEIKSKSDKMLKKLENSIEIDLDSKAIELEKMLAIMGG
jgi:hypothetical protein